MDVIDQAARCGCANLPCSGCRQAIFFIGSPLFSELISMFALCFFISLLKFTSVYYYYYLFQVAWACRRDGGRVVDRLIKRVRLLKQTLFLFSPSDRRRKTESIDIKNNKSGFLGVIVVVVLASLANELFSVYTVATQQQLAPLKLV